MASHTIKVTGVSEELLRLLDQRIQAQHASGRAEYIRELIRKDVLGTPGTASTPGHSAAPRSFRDILAPVHAETLKQGYTDQEMDRDIEDAVRETRTPRRSVGAP